MSINNLGISAKVLIATTLVSLALITLSTIYMLQNVSKISNETKENRIVEMKYLLDESIKHKEDIGLTNAITIANDIRLINALKTDNREEALKILSKISNNFKAHTSYKNVKIHLHTKDIHSFLRAWNPKKFGDDLSSFRKTLVKVNRDKKAFTTFEAGRAGLVLRGIAPLMINNEYYGSIEFIQGLNSVAKSFDSKQKHFMLLMNQDLSSVTSLQSNLQEVGSYQLSQKFIHQDFFNKASNIDFKQLLKTGSYQDNNYLYTYQEVIDFNGKSLGIFLLGENVKHLSKAVKNSTSTIYKSTIAMILLLLILSVVIFIVINKLVLSEIKELQHTIKYVVSPEKPTFTTVS
jgi:methyl-accepting chemotaxis protein